MSFPPIILPYLSNCSYSIQYISNFSVIYCLYIDFSLIFVCVHSFEQGMPYIVKVWPNELSFSVWLTICDIIFVYSAKVLDYGTIDAMEKNVL